MPATSPTSRLVRSDWSNASPALASNTHQAGTTIRREYQIDGPARCKSTGVFDTPSTSQAVVVLVAHQTEGPEACQEEMQPWLSADDRLDAALSSVATATCASVHGCDEYFSHRRQLLARWQPLGSPCIHRALPRSPLPSARLRTLADKFSCPTALRESCPRS